MAHDTQLFTNNAVSLLAAPIGAGATSLTVMAGLGASYPNPNPGEYFLVTLENQAGTVREIIRVDARVGDTFTVIQRAQEGSTAVAWAASLGNDTLVDHRVTAETMRLAMTHPNPGTPGVSGIDIEDHGVPVPTSATTLNFSGDVTVTDNGTSKTITIGASSSIIQGETTLAPIIVPSGGTVPVSDGTYSQYSRGFKFYVTLYQPSTFESASFEVMANVSGNLATNAEVVQFSRYGRVGKNFGGNVVITLDTALKQIKLAWNNTEPSAVEVMSIRIQHLA